MSDNKSRKTTKTNKAHNKNNNKKNNNKKNNNKKNNNKKNNKKFFFIILMTGNSTLMLINIICSIVWILLTWAITMTIYTDYDGCKDFKI